MSDVDWKARAREAEEATVRARELVRAYRRRARRAESALELALSALDSMMGDTDLDGDDSAEMRAMRNGREVLDSRGAR